MKQKYANRKRVKELSQEPYSMIDSMRSKVGNLKFTIWYRDQE